MQNRINKKVTDYIQSFKQDICLKITNESFESKNDLIKYIYDYNNFELKDEDMNKRQRNKTTICISERCRQSVQMENNVVEERERVLIFVEHIRKVNHMVL